MKPQSITSLPPSPDDDRHRREVQYFVMMSIRVLCVLAIPFTHGWWILLPILGAVFLPYFAVVVANVKGGGSRAPEQPTLALPATPTDVPNHPIGDDPAAESDRS
ncbi:MAG TPA: DUF3099 domain-containing protein [Candidatus Lumbricidophila sp.]|nr:DUF3099 domain-containing protein [Candidatus Lumbricidophila sp.]